MKKEDFVSLYRAGMADVHVSPPLKRRTLDVIEGREPVMMKKKVPVVLMIVLAVLLMGAVAVASVARMGIVDFASRMSGAYVPQDAQTYVQKDVLTLESDVATVYLRELYYDGAISRMTVEVVPANARTMLLGADMLAPQDYWDGFSLNGVQEETEPPTIAQVYRQGGYQAAYAVDAWLWPETGDTNGGSGDWIIGEDGTLTLYLEEEYDSVQPQRDVTFALYLTPYAQPFGECEEYMAPDPQTVLRSPLTLFQAEYDNQTYVSTAAADYPSVGVRVEEIRMEVRAQDIHVTIDYTVTDREAFDRLEHGLWFEFVDPDSTALEPYDQRLAQGMSGGGWAGPVEGEDRETAVHYRQSESLGRNELHQTYTLRVFDAWQKDRFETNTFTMKRVE